MSNPSQPASPTPPSQEPDPIFGIRMASKSVLKAAPLVIVYGAPKLGKTLDAAISFSDAFWLTSDPKVLRAYASWFHEKDEHGKRKNAEAIETWKLRDPELPWQQGGMARISMAEYMPNMISRVPTWSELRRFIQTVYAPALEAKKWPTRGLVIDEASEFFRRARLEIDESEFVLSKNGNIDGFKANQLATDFMMYLAQMANSTGYPVIMLAGEKAPKWHEKGEHAGKLQYRGGPDIGTGNQIRKICHCADVIIHRVIIEQGKESDLRDKDSEKAEQAGTSRVEYVISQSDTWERGARDVRAHPRFGLRLREFLTECEFALG